MEYSNLKTHAYDTIKEKIINCQYMPNEFINENILIQEIGSSRTPVREAINRLEQENLLRIIPKKGIMICELSLNEIDMIYEARGLIEPYTIKNYAINIDKKILESFKEKFTKKDMDCEKDIYKVDDDFHSLINSASTNKYFSNMLKQINNQNHRVRILSSCSKDRLSDSQNEHLNIIIPMLEGDFKNAEKQMKIHLENARKTAFDFLISNGGWKSDFKK